MPNSPATSYAEPATSPTANTAGREAHACRALPACGAVRAVEAVLLILTAAFFALHFVHLQADFPNHSAWMDWSKYTDEGWYGDAAIRHYELGHWNVPGDFNPAAALPVWPVVEMALFRVTGVSLVAARALTVVVFGLILLLSYLLVRRWSGAWAGARSVGPALAVLLLAASPFCFVFSRLAILEPLLILWTLVALLAASTAGAASAVLEGAAGLAAGPERRRLQKRAVAWSVALGVLLPLMVLTKTTAVFLFPAVGWMLWAASEYRLRAFARAAGVAGGVGALGWGAYYGLFVRPHYLLDYQYLFSANAYTGITASTFWQVMHDTFFDISWMGETLAWLALAAAAGSLVCFCNRRLRGTAAGSPLAASLLLWVLGYGAFLAYHANLQPRYYLVLAVPLTLLVALDFGTVLVGAGNREQGTASREQGTANREQATAANREQGTANRAAVGEWLLRLAAAVSGGALAVAIVAGGYWTVWFVQHPEYTFVNAASAIHAEVERELAEHVARSPLVLSISGADLSLMTGLPSICDDFGSMTLPDRVAAYKPGWFATWNDVEDDKMEALAPMYRLVRVMAVPAFDDPERNLLILYRLDPLETPGPAGRPGRRRSLAVPQRLRSKVGEQPSPVQLKH